ncbi:MAG: hypothetical protein ACYC4N_30265, partial [Pirellulaceae bacterium]
EVVELPAGSRMSGFIVLALSFFAPTQRRKPRQKEHQKAARPPKLGEWGKRSEHPGAIHFGL